MVAFFSIAISGCMSQEEFHQYVIKQILGDTEQINSSADNSPRPKPTALPTETPVPTETPEPIAIDLPTETPVPTKIFKAFSKYPSTRRDVALLVPKTLSYDEILTVIKKYKLVKLRPVDMFPHTPHIENVATLIHNLS